MEQMNKDIIERIERNCAIITITGRIKDQDISLAFFELKSLSLLWVRIKYNMNITWMLKEPVEKRNLERKRTTQVDEIDKKWRGGRKKKSTFYGDKMREKVRGIETQQVEETYFGPGSRGGRRMAEAVKGIMALRWSLSESQGLELLNRKQPSGWQLGAYNCDTSQLWILSWLIIFISRKNWSAIIPWRDSNQ